MKSWLACAAAALCLAVCSPRTARDEIVIADDKAFSADHWTVMRSEELFNEAGKQHPTEFEMVLAIVEGHEERTFMIVGCVESEPESVMVIIKRPEVIGHSGKTRLPVTVRADDGANTVLFDVDDDAVSAYLDLRRSAGRHLMTSILNANKPFAVQIGKDPIIRFNPSNGVLKSIFAQCHEAKPSLGA